MLSGTRHEGNAHQAVMHALTREAEMKKADNTQCCSNRNLYTAGANAKWQGHRGGRSGHFSPCDPANTFPKTPEPHPHNLYARVRSSRTHNRPRLETVPTSTNRSTDGRVTPAGDERTTGVAPNAPH